MSWFTTMVLISPETPDDGVFDAVSTLLAPFDSNRTVAPYLEPCFCVGADSRADPACAECDGAGQIRTTVNPHGYWESWRIGGGTCEDWLGPTHAMRAGAAADAQKVPFVPLPHHVRSPSRGHQTTYPAGRPRDRRPPATR